MAATAGADEFVDPPDRWDALAVVLAGAWRLGLAEDLVPLWLLFASTDLVGLGVAAEAAAAVAVAGGGE